MKKARLLLFNGKIKAELKKERKKAYVILRTNSFLLPELLQTLNNERVEFKNLCEDMTESDLYIVFDVYVRGVPIPIFISIEKELTNDRPCISVHLDLSAQKDFPYEIDEPMIKETKRAIDTLTQNLSALLKNALLQTPHRLRLLTQANYFDFGVLQMYLTDLYSTMIYQREVGFNELAPKTFKRFTKYTLN